MIEMLALLAAAADPPLSARVRPEQNYLSCLVANGTSFADDAPESEWQAGWRQTVERCRGSRAAWSRYYFLGHPTQRDQANAVEWQLMETEAQAYQRYRNPSRVTTYVDRFIAPEESPDRAGDR